MKVQLDFGPDTKVAVEKDEAGEIVSITLEPKFASRSAQAVLAYGAAVNDHGSVLDRFSLVASGANGKVTKKSRTAPVKALVDMTDEERRASEKDDDGEESS